MAETKPTTQPNPVNTSAENIPVKEEPTEPWKPALILAREPRPGVREKWVRVDLVDRFLAEGWKLVASEDDKTPRTDIDGSQLDTSVRKRELVLMEIPEAVAKSRESYYRNLSDGALGGSVDEFKKVAGKDSGKSYGDIKIIQGGS
jgi:hypothetical protein